MSNDGSIIGDAENDTPKFISCSKNGTPKNGTSRTSIYGSYPPPGSQMHNIASLDKALRY